MRRAQVMRMIWIDAYIEAGEFLLRRQHLRLAFDISIPQASADLAMFQGLFPGRIAYDKSEKGYRAAEGSRQAFEDHEHSAVFLACSFAADAQRRLEAQA